MNNDTPADAITQENRVAVREAIRDELRRSPSNGKIREGAGYCYAEIEGEVDVFEIADAALSALNTRTPSLAAQDGLVEAVTRFMPTNINLANKNVDDREIIPLDVTLGELRAIAAALASIEVKS